MTIEELRKLFLKFMREGSDDYCSKCAYCEKDKCARGAWSVNEEGDLECEFPDKYATEPCIEGLYKYYIEKRSYL